MKLLRCIISLLVVLAWGCGSPLGSPAASSSSRTERAGGSDQPAGSESDAAETDSGQPDDSMPEDTIDPACDQDADGYESAACGGDDCDDDDVNVHPDGYEICDFVDNNCDGDNNEEMDCSVYAHTGSSLYLVDPFALAMTLVGPVPELFDFDTDPSGALYGISPSALHWFEGGSAAWEELGTLGTTSGTANGFAIDSRGRAFATAGNHLYVVNLDDGSTAFVGETGDDIYSSGDCVVNKADTLYMTSSYEWWDGERPGDDLVLVDSATGQGTRVGNIGFDGVYGLTAAWGNMFGFTGSGELLLIDEETGQGELLHIFDGLSWYGAASSPTR